MRDMQNDEFAHAFYNGFQISNTSNYEMVLGDYVPYEYGANAGDGFGKFSNGTPFTGSSKLLPNKAIK